MQLFAHPLIANTAEEGALERVEHDMDVKAGVAWLRVTAALGNAVTFLRLWLGNREGGLGLWDCDKNKIIYS